MSTLRVLTIGHSYVVALNRAVMARVARDPRIELTVAAPAFFRGDLRPLELQEASDESVYRLVGLDELASRNTSTFSSTKVSAL